MANRLSRFCHLSGADQKFLVKVSLLVWIVRISLWCFPFRWVRWQVSKLAREGMEPVSKAPAVVTRVVGAVTLASRYVPAATCLTQALVTKVLLSRSGHQAIVRLGVARGNDGKFTAHAWVESDSRVVIGGTEASVKDYEQLTTSSMES
jgi:hypothetical protein